MKAVIPIYQNNSVKQSPSSQALDQGELPLSIVIPCKNEVEHIGRLLRTLSRQSYDLSKVPIYIADGGSNDGTLEFIRRYTSSTRMNITIVSGGYPGRARNIGAGQSNSTFLLFLDADIYLLEDDFIESVMEKAIDNDLDCIGTLVNGEQANWKDKVIWNALTLFMYAYPVLKPFSTGMCVFIRRNAFNRIGGFDEAVLLGEDVELTSQIPKERFGIVHRHVVTSNRRFKRAGYAKTMWMYSNAHFRREYRHRDHSAYFMY